MPTSTEDSEEREYCRRAKSLCALQRFAALSTIAKGAPDSQFAGFPFGSVTPYDVTLDGSFIIYVARISQHYLNLKADPRASLLVCDPQGVEDPQSYARLTVQLRLREVAPAEQALLAQRYFERFPDSQAYSLQHSFVFLRGQPERLRWIGGFGEIAWLNLESFAQEPLDELSYHGAAIMTHMNADHADALALYLQAFCLSGPPHAAHTVRMTAICSSGFEIRVPSKQGHVAVSIRFPTRLSRAAQAREAMIELLREARALLAGG